MKTIMITGAISLFSVSVSGQVGINTQTPAATLDVASRTTGTATTVPEGLIAPRLTIADLNAKSSAYGASQAGSLIYVTDAANGSASGQTTNITAVGYYFFDGSGWLKVSTGGGGSTGSGNDLYSNNGTLSANRTVALSDKTLAFNASPTTGTSHFTVDDTTLSVDALNNKVGLGTYAPVEKLHIENGNMFMHHDSPTIYFQSTVPNNSSNPNSNNGSIVFYEGANSSTEGMYIRHINNPTGLFGGNQLQLGSIENGTYNPVMKINNITKQIIFDSPNFINFGTVYPKLLINSDTANGAIQITDGTQGSNRVLTSDASGRGTWKTGILAAPSTVYTWDNSGASGTLGYYQHYTYGPYTVAKTGWYLIQSEWRYQQQSANGDNGLGTVQLQINTASGNTMIDYDNPSILDMPANDTCVINGMRAFSMLSGKMIYLTTNRNYYVHVESNNVNINGSQKFKLNYVQ